MRIDQPNTFLEWADEVRNKYGNDKFFHGSEEECQKALEAFFAYFFIIGFRKLSKKDWWVYQPKQFPDLKLVSFTEHPISAEILQYELVTIPGHCIEIPDMLQIVKNKIETKHYAPNGPCGLLVFSNNAQSNVLEGELYKVLDKIHPFTEVWTTHLEFSDSTTISKIVVSKVRPLPVIRFEFDSKDSSLYKHQAPLNLMEVVEEGDTKYLRIKKEVEIYFQKEAIKERLRKNKATN